MTIRGYIRFRLLKSRLQEYSFEVENNETVNRFGEILGHIERYRSAGDDMTPFFYSPPETRWVVDGMKARKISDAMVNYWIIKDGGKSRRAARETSERF